MNEKKATAKTGRAELTGLPGVVVVYQIAESTGRCSAEGFLTEVTCHITHTISGEKRDYDLTKLCQVCEFASGVKLSSAVTGHPPPSPSSDPLSLTHIRRFIYRRQLSVVRSTSYKVCVGDSVWIRRGIRLMEMGLASSNGGNGGNGREMELEC